MAKRPVASQDGVITAYEKWVAARESLLKRSNVPSEYPNIFMELARVFADKEYIFGELVAKAFSNPYCSKISLVEISPEFRDFIKQNRIYISGNVRKAIRTWFEVYFGDRIRVEGDSYDLYLELDPTMQPDAHQQFLNRNVVQISGQSSVPEEPDIDPFLGSHRNMSMGA
jgi:hypothetical protein